MAQRPGLIMLCGLPATGKSTVARPVARAFDAAYLRIDTIEQALADSGELPDKPRTSGYVTAYALAHDQLSVGLSTVVECVNPLKITRDAWKDVADARHAWMLEVELVCSDEDEHRSRVEGRTTDIPGLRLPTWQDVRNRDYESWDRKHLVIDTAEVAAEDAVGVVVERAMALSQQG